MHARFFALSAPVLMIAACGSPGGTDGSPSEPPSNLDISSAKRQCNTTASLALLGQGIADEAITEVCDCTIDRLVDEGSYTAASDPGEEDMDAALNACIDQVAASMETE